MGRYRSIKPEMAKHELLFELELETKLPIRFTWAILPTQCDREGRFKWRPRSLKLDILPYDVLDFSHVLDALLTRGQLVKYRVGDAWYGWIPTFLTHQVINNREQASQLPSIQEAEEIIDPGHHASGSREAHDSDASTTRLVHAQGEGRGRGKGRGEGERVTSRVNDAPLSELQNFSQMVCGNCGDISRWTVEAVEGQLQLEAQKGIPMEDAAKGMIEAWSAYKSKNLNPEKPLNAEYFYSKGHWRSYAPDPTKPKRKTAAEEAREQIYGTAEVGK